MRSQFHHIIDVAPTVLDAAHITKPQIVNGVKQKPIEGVSMRYSFNDDRAKSHRTTQYFEMFGNRGIYKDGWMATRDTAVCRGRQVAEAPVPSRATRGSYTMSTRTSPRPIISPHDIPTR